VWAAAAAAASLAPPRGRSGGATELRGSAWGGALAACCYLKAELMITMGRVVLMLLPLLLGAAAAVAAVGTGAGGGYHRRTPSQTIAYCDDGPCGRYLIVEAENFSAVAPAVGSGWTPQAWAHDPNMFSSDVSNVFMNRRAYLHAALDATAGASATAVVDIPAAGTYTLLVRYEAGYRFSSPFNVTIRQGDTVFHQSYGLRTSPKVWFAAGCTNKYGGLSMLDAECRYSYGTTENMVWEGPSMSNNYTAPLKKGAATIVLSVADARGEITERNIDTLVLTMNTSDILMRLGPDGKSRPLQLDGLIGTQAGEVFAQIESHVWQALHTYSTVVN
jgi:hypothetical protein